MGRLMIEVRSNFILPVSCRQQIFSFLVSLLFCLISFSPLQVRADESVVVPLSPFVAHIPLEMMILPGTAHFLEEAITDAKQQGAQIAIVTIDTPGGMLQSSQEMIQTIFRSPIPVVIYVSPTGATATSAGVFITLAGHIAAMAPGTTIGAAHPVSGEGKDIEGDMRAKVENMTTAMVRSIAEERGRSIEWAEKAVRESISVTDREALKEKVIDIVATDFKTLLTQIKGKKVKVAGQLIDLADFSELPVRRFEISRRDSVLNVLANPSVLALLWLGATTGISIELYNPGAILPGVIGAICLVLALAVSQIIPVSQGALLLLVLGAAMIALELFVTSGILGIGGVVSLIIGALYLVDPLAAPGLEIDRTLIFCVAATIGIGLLALVRLLIRTQGAKLKTGSDGLIGLVGEALQNIVEHGKVRVNGEIWNATVVSGVIEKGAQVEVVAVKDGMILEVKSL
jgi:membrane-bound serine protease (ClpP class)